MPILNCKSWPAVSELAQKHRRQRGFKCRLVFLLVWDLWAACLVATGSTDRQERLCGNCGLGCHLEETIYGSVAGHFGLDKLYV